VLFLHNNILPQAVRRARPQGRKMVNSDLQIYLTDFLNRTFVGKIAQNRSFHGGLKFKCARVYHFHINYNAMLRKCARFNYVPTSLCLPRLSSAGARSGHSLRSL
ncbi:MAG: hypothetical protein ACLPOA_01840, partial [Methylocella sp.]